VLFAVVIEEQPALRKQPVMKNFKYSKKILHAGFSENSFRIQTEDTERGRA
jgi:hypothetical protein